MESEYFESSGSFDCFESLVVVEMQILSGVTPSCRSWLRRTVSKFVSYLVGNGWSILYNASLMPCACAGGCARAHGCAEVLGEISIVTVLHAMGVGK